MFPPYLGRGDYSLGEPPSLAEGEEEENSSPFSYIRGSLNLFLKWVSAAASLNEYASLCSSGMAA
jgi:hypothetical protein